SVVAEAKTCKAKWMASCLLPNLKTASGTHRLRFRVCVVSIQACLFHDLGQRVEFQRFLAREIGENPQGPLELAVVLRLQGDGQDVHGLAFLGAVLNA